MLPDRPSSGDRWGRSLRISRSMPPIGEPAKQRVAIAGVKRGHPLALEPGKTGRLPAAGGAAVPIVVERSFETASDIVTGPIARLGHRLSRSQAPASRTA